MTVHTEHVAAEPSATTAPVRAVIALLADPRRRADGSASAFAWELERQGQPVSLVSDGAVWSGAPSTPPLSDRPSLRETLRFLFDSGIRAFPLATRVLMMSRTPSIPFVQMIGLLPSGIALARGLKQAGVAHLHVEDHPRLLAIASIASLLSGVTFSISSLDAGHSASHDELRARAHFQLHRSADTMLHAAAASLVGLLDAKSPVLLGEDAQALTAEAQAFGLPVSGIRWLHVRNDSRVAELTIAPGYEIIIKHHRSRRGESRPASSRALHEAEVMRHIRQLLLAAPRGANDPLCSVPEVMYTRPENGTVIMQNAAGLALDRLMTSVSRRLDVAPRLALPVRQAGTWLRLMQQGTLSTEDRGTVTSNVISLALADLESAVATDRLVRRNHAAIRAFLEYEIPSGATSVTGHHGDFWPGNIFVGQDRVEVIDFEGYRAGFPLEDVAYFLLFLGLMFPRFGGRVPELDQAFFEGYGLPSEERSLLRPFVVVKALQILARQSAAGSRSPLRIWTRYMLRRRVMESLA